MSEDLKVLDQITQSEYKYGFHTDIETDYAPAGLNEDTIRFISAKKEEPEFLLEWRLKAFRNWQKMEEPHWPNVKYPEIDYQKISYYAAPRQKPQLNSLDEVDPELKATFDKLGISLDEQKLLA
ncbi:MAG TPA: Fe-S cluster assembly protein SufB, partial [Anseongella sp.]|nr:Fe-S cluster assembly protein SufB [Anseongella sp.]